MAIPAPVFDPPFRVTRASHVRLNVRDLAASKAFYTGIFGVAVTDETAEAVYLRGLEEACHHSIVLQRSDAPGTCERIGFRVLTEDDLEQGYTWFEARGWNPEWVEMPFQRRTLHVTDPRGIKLEFCASMDVVPRLLVKFSCHQGGKALRLDHFQVLVPDAAAAWNDYTPLGFRASEYIVDGEGRTTAAFLQRKGNSHDFVLVNGRGPRLHHTAFMVADNQGVIAGCDAAGELGFADAVERGPGRHGAGHALFVYFRDPDGHRIELNSTTYTAMDSELEPVRWDRTAATVVAQWGLPAQRTWFDDASPFPGSPLSLPDPAPNPLTLEKYLAAKS
ncbi:MAG: 3,4-dihydroxyphenylacetate 2,3-dioxygenase [Sphingomonas sp.]|nr:MAG: 3,4-dihydroxyphenylacetate 2,3-dioxygenase [Sphingomonas sp.]